MQITVDADHHDHPGTVHADITCPSGHQHAA
jgi:biotin synthase